MSTKKSPQELLANAEAQDYEDLHPEEPFCKENTCYHIIGGTVIGLVIVGLVTLGFVVFG